MRFRDSVSSVVSTVMRNGKVAGRGVEFRAYDEKGEVVILAESEGLKLPGTQGVRMTERQYCNFVSAHQGSLYANTARLFGLTT